MQYFGIEDSIVNAVALVHDEKVLASENVE